MSSKPRKYVDEQTRAEWVELYKTKGIWDIVAHEAAKGKPNSNFLILRILKEEGVKIRNVAEAIELQKQNRVRKKELGR